MGINSAFKGLICILKNIHGSLLLCGIPKVEKNCTSKLQRIKKEKYFIAVMGEGLRAECKEGCILSQLKVNIFLYIYLIDSLVKKLNTSTPKSTLMVCSSWELQPLATDFPASCACR
jgi:hypothetical protein